MRTIMALGLGFPRRWPPLLEGDLFTSPFEGADVFTLVALRCKVELAYLDKDAPMPKPVQWTDEVFPLRWMTSPMGAGRSAMPTNA
jgi:hypothetical protein